MHRNRKISDFAHGCLGIFMQNAHENASRNRRLNNNAKIALYAILRDSNFPSENFLKIEVEKTLDFSAELYII